MCQSCVLLCCCSVTQSCPTLCSPMDYSMPGLPVVHHLPVCPSSCPLHRWCHPAISFSDALSSSYPQSFQASGTFKWVGCSHQVTKILHLQHQSFQWIFRTDFPLVWLVWSPCSPREFQESSPAPQFEGINSLAFCLLYGHTLTTVYDHLTVQTFVNRVMSYFSTHCLGLS